MIGPSSEVTDSRSNRSEGQRFWLPASTPSNNLNRRGARIRFAASCGAQFDQRIGLLRPGAEDAARPVILETAPDQPLARSECRAAQRVAGKAIQQHALKRRVEPARAVDQAAGGDSKR